MIFSNKAAADFMMKNFECAWEAVRPVPKIEIDFGNGYKLKRTLNGNIATYYCTSDGKVFDILPGLVTREEFFKRSGIALKMHEKLATTRRKSSLVYEYHMAMKDLELADARKIREVARLTAIKFDVSKAMVERGLKTSVKDMIEEHAKALEVVDSGKFEVEQPVKDLLKDTEYNRKHRYPRVHEILASQPLVSPSTLTKKIYKDVLDTDLDDPYLGLAPKVIGGEGGRIEPGK